MGPDLTGLAVYFPISAVVSRVSSSSSEPGRANLWFAQAKQSFALPTDATDFPLRMLNVSVWIRRRQVLSQGL